jgi:hypothetical protein
MRSLCIFCFLNHFLRILTQKDAIGAPSGFYDVIDGLHARITSPLELIKQDYTDLMDLIKTRDLMAGVKSDIKAMAHSWEPRKVLFHVPTYINSKFPIAK